MEACLLAGVVTSFRRDAAAHGGRALLPSCKTQQQHQQQRAARLPQRRPEESLVLLGGHEEATETARVPYRSLPVAAIVFPVDVAAVAAVPTTLCRRSHRCRRFRSCHDSGQTDLLYS